MAAEGGIWARRMNELSSVADTANCPDAKQLLALGRGRLGGDALSALSAHIISCERCQTQVDAVDEQSDTFVRGLSALPCTPADEAAFQRLVEELLADPEPFTGRDDTGADGRPLLEEEEETLPRKMAGYQLLERIGRGATGTVYKARHLKLDRLVAVKLLTPEHVADPGSIARFIAEMKAVGQLDHPHIIRATDAGEEGGRHFLVMEYREGIDLSRLVALRGPLPVGAAVELVRQAALGLAFAHEHGMVHRDVKPSNLLLTFAGQVKLLDLGLVSRSSDAGANRHAATENIPRGTADYMPPEQWTRFADVDQRSDLYSLGCTLHKLLTGHAPYAPLPDAYRSKLDAHARAAIPWLRDERPHIPSAVARVVRKLLAKDPSHRFPDARAVVSALEPYAKSEAVAEVLRPFQTCLASPELRIDPQTTSRRWLRRGVLAALAAGVPLWVWSLGLPRWIRPAAEPQRNRWRSLRPQSPVWFVSKDAAASYREHADLAIEVQSTDRVLLNLGRPLLGTFALRTTLEQGNWQGGAGLCFRCRHGHRDGNATHTYQALELVRDAAPNNTFRHRLVWTRTHWQTGPQGDMIELTPWAEVPVVIHPADTSHTLSVTLGCRGFPEVKWDGQLLPESRWTSSFEANIAAGYGPSRLAQFYLGKVGLIHTEGLTTFRDTSLMYVG